MNSQNNQQGGSNGGNTGQSQGSQQDGSNSDQSQASGGDDGESIERNPNADPNWKPATTGAVIDEEHDGRLRENREEGVTKGTTEHSSQAPFVGQDNSGSVNSEGKSATDVYEETHGQAGQEATDAAEAAIEATDESDQGNR